MEGEVAGWAVPDLIIGNRVEILVDKPGWVGVQVWELCGTSILVCQRDNVRLRQYSALARPVA
jgi:hypothetical protein